MRKPFLTVFVAAALVTGGSLLSSAADRLVSGQVPYPFRVGSSQLPAGRYEILRESPENNVLVLRCSDTGKAVFVPIISLLSPRDNSSAELVFDKVGLERFLSEISVPYRDGYAVPGAPVRHTHERLNLTKVASAEPVE